MDSNTINIASLNVRGFRDVSKHFKVFNMVNLESIDILFLQETYCVNIKEAKYWEKSFNGKCFGAFGENQSSGVGIVINSGLNYKVSHFDFQGRF